MLEIDPDAFAAAHAAGAYVIDVREDHEYAAGHVPGALLTPLSHLGSVITRLPGTEPVYVICASGNRSKAAAGMLRRAGLDAYSVAGGTAAWERAGRPVVLGSRSGTVGGLNPEGPETWF
jgi:rhodanese-related sulfurtransferase